MIGIFAPLFYTAEEARTSLGSSANQKFQVVEENLLEIPNTVILKRGCKILCSSTITIVSLGTFVDCGADCFVLNQSNNLFETEFINKKHGGCRLEKQCIGIKKYNLKEPLMFTFQKLALKPKHQTDSIYFGPKSKPDCIEVLVKKEKEEKEDIEGTNLKHDNYDLVMDVPFLLGKRDFIIEQGKIFPTNKTSCRLYKIECINSYEKAADIKTQLRWFTMKENSFKSFLSEAEAYLMCTEQQMNDALTQNMKGTTKVAKIESEVTENSTVQRVKEKVDKLEELFEDLAIED